MVSEVPADLLVKIYMSERFHSNNPEYVHELVKKQGISSDNIEIVADNVTDTDTTGDYGGCKNEGQQYFRYAYRQSVADSC